MALSGRGRFSQVSWSVLILCQIDCKHSGACTQIMEKIRPTSHAAIAQPAPVKKPTQNQTPIRYRSILEGMLDSPCGDEVTNLRHALCGLSHVLNRDTVM